MFSTTMTAESDDDAEVDGAKGKKICVLAPQNENDDAEEEGEGDVDADDDRASQISEKNPLNDEDEQASEDEVMKNRARRDVDERRAVVIRDQFHARRQASIGVDLLDLGLDARNDIVRVQRPVHDEDCGHDVVVIVTAGLSKTRHVADIDFG